MMMMMMMIASRRSRGFKGDINTGQRSIIVPPSIKQAHHTDTRQTLANPPGERTPPLFHPLAHATTAIAHNDAHTTTIEAGTKPHTTKNREPATKMRFPVSSE